MQCPCAQTSQRMALSGVTAGDPIANFGKSAAVLILNKVRAVPTVQRKEALRAVLNAVDATLWDTVATKANKLQGDGVLPAVALERALSAALANSLVEKIVQTGAGGSVQPLSGFFDGLTNIFKSAGGAISSAASSVVNFGKSVAGNIGGLACQALSSQLAPMAAGAGAAALGVPPQLGAAGVSIVQKLCPGGKPSASMSTAELAALQQLLQKQQLAQPQPSQMSAVVPVAVGGGLLAALALLL